MPAYFTRLTLIASIQTSRVDEHYEITLSQIVRDLRGELLQTVNFDLRSRKLAFERLGRTPRDAVVAA